MGGELKVIRLSQENLYVKREGKYFLVYLDKTCLSRHYKINIPLFYKIAIYTKTRRSYKSVLTAFFDELKAVGLNSFKSRESLKRAGSGCGSLGGGGTAFWLGVFCLCCDMCPRNINVVRACCEKCKNKDISVCGSRPICGDYYGCGKGVTAPLKNVFNVKTIPKLRVEIESEVFKKP